MKTRRDFLLSAIAIVALLASGAWERADATPQGVQEATVDLRSADGGSRGEGSLPLASLALPGAPHEDSRVLLLSGRNQQADKLGGAPQPSGAVGTVLVGGFATWYDDPRKTGRYAAAGPLIREALGDWRGKTIRVTSGDRSTVVVLSDWCACGERHDWPTLLDLSPTAFGDLAPLSQGVVFVEIELVDRPDQSGEDPPPHPADDRMRLEDRALPATDTTATPDAVGKDGRVE